MTKQIDADEMAEQILAVVRTADAGDDDRLFVGMMVVGDVLASIECAACRENAAFAVLKAFPKLVEEAMAKAAVRSPGSAHKH